MLRKLLKYDLKWIYKVVIVFYILTFIFAFLSRFFITIDNSLLFTIIGKIFSGFALSMAISSLINCLMRSWVRFIRNVYKDESYLTHTLPVDKKQIYSSKVLSALICSFTTVIVIVLCLFICYYSKDNLETIKNVLEITAGVYNTTVIKLLLVISLVIFLEIVFILLVGYVGIIIGFKSNKNKMVKTLITAFIIYLLTSCVSLILIYLFGLFNSDIMNLINTKATISITSIKKIMLFVIIIYMVYNIIYYFIGKWQLEKGVNVD